MSDVQPQGNLTGDLDLESGGSPEVVSDKPRWFGTWVGQAPARYRDDEAKLDDLLQHRSIGEVLDRMYSGEERLASLLKETGIPETAEEYNLSPPKLPEFMADKSFEKYREEMSSYVELTHLEIRELAHELHLTPEAAQRVGDYLHGKIFDAVKAGIEDQVRKKAEGLDQLKVDWKGEFKPNAEVSRRAIETFGKEALVALFDELGVSNHPAVTKTFYEIGKAMGEGTLVPGSTAPAEPSPEEQKRANLRERYSNSPEMFAEGRGY